MAKGMQASIRFNKRLASAGEHHPRSTQGERSNPWLDGADAYSLGGLIAATSDNGHAVLQPGQLGRLGSDKPGDLRSFVGPGQPARGNFLSI